MADILPLAYRSDVRPLEFTNPLDLLRGTKTYHGLTIEANNRIIGRIKSWHPTAYSREGAHVYELDHRSFGRPVDYVPGVATGFEIAFARVEMWLDEIEIALGLTSFDQIWNDLTDQTRPFEINEYLWRGAIPYRHWVYSGCWFKDRNETEATSQGDGIYEVAATVAYIKRQAVPG